MASKKRRDPPAKSKPVETPTKRRKTHHVVTYKVDKNADIFVWGSPDMGQCGPVHSYELSKPWPVYQREKNAKELADKNLKTPQLRCAKVLDIKAVGYHNALLAEVDKKNVLYTWGCNDDAVLGRETSPDEDELEEEKKMSAEALNSLKSKEDVRQCTPTPVKLKDVVGVSVGNHHMIALTADGDVWGWGIYKDDDGFIGFDPKIKERDRKCFTPIQVPGLPSNMVQVASSANVSLALTSTGKVWEWGCTGQRVPRRCQRLRLHSLDYNQKQLQAHQVYHAKAVEEIYAGGDHHFAIDSTRQVYAWGINGWGQLGIGKKANKCQEKPQKVLKLGKNIIQLACGLSHSLALSSDGEVYSWGRASYGQLGTGKKEKKIVIDTANYIPKNQSSKGKFSLTSTKDGDVEIKQEDKPFVFSAPSLDATGSGDAPAPFVFGGGDAAPVTSGFFFGGTQVEENGSAAAAIFGDSDPKETKSGFSFAESSSKEPAQEVKVEESAAFVFDAAAADTAEPKKKPKRDEGDENEYECIWEPELVPFFETLRNDTGEKAVSIACGDNHSIVITDQGKVYTFGFNASSQLGLKKDDPEVFYPELVAFGKTYNARRAAAGSDHTILCATPK